MSGLGQGLDSLPGGCLGEPVAVLAFGDQDVGVVQESVDGRGRDAFGRGCVGSGHMSQVMCRS